MKLLGIIFTVAATFTGLTAAFYWYKSSKIELAPSWGGTDTGDTQINQMNWIAGLLDAGSKSAYLNKRAARLTACAVFFSTLSSLIGYLC